jgi:hypothetical protein
LTNWRQVSFTQVIPRSLVASLHVCHAILTGLDPKMRSHVQCRSTQPTWHWLRAQEL